MVIWKVNAADGAVVWKMNFGTSYSGLESVTVLPNDDFVVGGFIDSEGGMKD